MRRNPLSLSHFRWAKQITTTLRWRSSLYCIHDSMCIFLWCSFKNSLRSIDAVCFCCVQSWNVMRFNISALCSLLSLSNCFPDFEMTVPAVMQSARHMSDSLAKQCSHWAHLSLILLSKFRKPRSTANAKSWQSNSWFRDAKCMSPNLIASAAAANAGSSILNATVSAKGLWNSSIMFMAVAKYTGLLLGICSTRPLEFAAHIPFWQSQSQLIRSFTPGIPATAPRRVEDRRNPPGILANRSWNLKSTRLQKITLSFPLGAWAHSFARTLESVAPNRPTALSKQLRTWLAPFPWWSSMQNAALHHRNLLFSLWQLPTGLPFASLHPGFRHGLIRAAWNLRCHVLFRDTNNNANRLQKDPKRE